MIEFDLSLSHQPCGSVLDGKIEFAEEMRFLLFAWNGDKLAWAKAPGFGVEADLSLCYYPGPLGHIQLITGIGMGGSTDLILSPASVPQRAYPVRLDLGMYRSSIEPLIIEWVSSS